MERLGNILFLIGTHFRSLRTLILDSKDYAQLIQMIGGEDKEFKSKPNASVLQVVTAQSDQQYEAMDDADDVLAE